MSSLDILSWNVAIETEVLYGHHVEALQLFTSMQHQGFLPSKILYNSLFAVTQYQMLKIGMSIHAAMHGISLDMDIPIQTSLIVMYGNCGKVELARRVFDNASKHDVISWTATMVVYGQNGKYEDVLTLFHRMPREALMPDSRAFVSVVDACVSMEALSEGMKLHFLIISSGVDMNLILITALINMYGKCGSLKDAHRVFLYTKGSNLASWNAIISSNAYNKSSDTIQLFERTLIEGVLPDKITFVSIFDACSNKNLGAVGKQMHARIVGNRSEKDMVVQTSLIDFYGSCGHFPHACKIFSAMRDHDYVSLISIVSACANCAAFVEGKQMHSYVICNKFERNVVLGTALINLYSKCGSIYDAHDVFIRLRDPNIISWNAIIGAYCQNGFGKETLSLYQSMRSNRVKPDAITFLSVLPACSHAGMLIEGCSFSLAMKQDYGIIPNIDHYNCMIDLLGRTGRLVEAQQLILNMRVEPCVASWATLLSACRKEVNVSGAEQAAFRIMQMDPKDATPYIMLANTYSAANRMNDAQRIMMKMRAKDITAELDKVLCSNMSPKAMIGIDSMHISRESSDAAMNMFIRSMNV
ncbi:hypothetical protein KP509_06G080700 [Ceratopteris richardii]|uniref:Pentatricopeptide repeat-containing protein n=2 Tax=Ceratopteris richardii TaxID=49495 RepID=A0A8T2UMQ8_CERRI|nr:hypothetical protein KP509_06G080700 [Ceratopteris richardii]